ncbi:hypothetical protein H3N56_10105 [Cetobacterium sp. 2A]|uniref:hypothetical protein n=1 Tax=Cetobacterium sp. 2A TaxID=2754723 RepID=UPI00163B6EB1|nr:hypothetical protein [Cetobacterium sp. 2A]MBC2856794.1 hypothetical protein [Cetobacterium sp. 2A]
MLTKEEFLKKIGKTEDQLDKEGFELSFIGEIGYDEGEDDGWEVVYKDPTKCVEVGLGCKCSTFSLQSIHTKL